MKQGGEGSSTNKRNGKRAKRSQGKGKKKTRRPSTTKHYEGALRRNVPPGKKGKRERKWQKEENLNPLPTQGQEICDWGKEKKKRLLGGGTKKKTREASVG